MSGPHRWKAGESGNPNGKTNGARDRLGRRFMLRLAVDFAKHGTQAIETLREKDPASYLKLCALAVPKEINVRHELSEQLASMTEDALHNAIAGLLGKRAALPAPERAGTAH